MVTDFAPQPVKENGVPLARGTPVKEMEYRCTPGYRIEEYLAVKMGNNGFTGDDGRTRKKEK